ncbi:hypothetical protein D3C74_337140 [compost metagenome]
MLPTTQAPNWSPYNLLYHLAKETVEPVVSEGCLTLTEGENVVEVGTGIVLRELANPKGDVYGNYQFNLRLAGWESTRMQFEAESILAIMKNNNRDYDWHTEVDPVGAYGKVKAVISVSNYDQSATYSVTYIKLDKSPIQPITGTLAANEKAQISDLTAGVAEALQRVSVVEQKKADEDAPGWITPTLINGFSYNNLGVNHNGYYKDSSGRVWLSLALVGVLPQGTQMFVLPFGYRPRTRVFVAGTNANELGLNAQAVAITIEPSGAVYVAACSTGTTLASVIFDGSFLAEQ